MFMSDKMFLSRRKSRGIRLGLSRQNVCVKKNIEVKEDSEADVSPGTSVLSDQHIRNIVTPSPKIGPVSPTQL